MPDAATLDLVLKRNAIERLKREKPPLDILQELPTLIESGYENIAEEDIVRLQWHGLYHDKPKVGYFMLRIKTPSGILSPQQLRTIGRLAQTFGRNEGELTTRQDIQLHWIRLDQLPAIFAKLSGAGLSTRGACGDAVRNITGCPVAGLDADELFDARPLIEEAAALFGGRREYLDLPRKHKITISTCAQQCNAPEINCIALIGTRKDGRPGYALRLGGGLSSVPRIARPLDVFVPVAEALDVLRAILDAWRTNLHYRVSRVKARLKFMVDDYGAEGMRAEIERFLGRRLEELPASPRPVAGNGHLGWNPQQQEGLAYAGFPLSLGRLSGDQMVRLADIAEAAGGDIRLTRQQNFILANIPHTEIAPVTHAVGALGFPLDANRLRATAIACVGSPLCNYAVAETKSKLDEILRHLEQTFGRAAEGIGISLDGCPHACAHHWVADIGLQGSTLRERGAAGEKQEAYEIYLRGGLGADAAIGRPIIRRVPAAAVKHYVERLVRAYLERRDPNETFKGFADRHSDAELIAIATGQPLVEGPACAGPSGAVGRGV